jgi:hypothetical protein
VAGKHNFQIGKGHQLACQKLMTLRNPTRRIRIYKILDLARVLPNVYKTVAFLEALVPKSKAQLELASSNCNLVK